MKLISQHLLAAWANHSKNSEINLTAQPNQSGLATWSVPQADKDAAKSHGGQEYQLRVYDVTDIDLDSQPAPTVQQYDCSESTTDKQIDSLVPEHDYQTEIGYVTDDGQWLKLARSEKIRISNNSNRWHTNSTNSRRIRSRRIISSMGKSLQK
ncbi:DUF4912 domain-containing protein [Okeania hirsuta]|uniref:DUF4912 domain-containing protein n=1 Tax=Okeania hirsuta TaxID=1458930 RepID=UPI0013749B40|nr:DUF4912 domain-containing protein [Okeania hirsuta]